jgi:dihydrofolate synthase/folylpolyglutamate synthase
MMMEDVENWVYSRYGRESYQPGLDRIGRSISDLKLKLQASKIITIAGTNGKGETTHRLSHLLHASSHCTWTSPHIHSMTERFSSEKGNISIEELQLLLQECHEIVKEKRGE